MGPILNIMTVRFTIEPSGDGGYIGTCSELGARLEATDLPALEQKMSSFARALVEEPRARQMTVLVHRRFPVDRALA